LRKIVECIPNFSEGRRAEVIDKIVEAIKSVPGAVLLDRESDADHNRSVITFVASPDRVVDAAIAAARKAAELIDLNEHKGEHPRMGATDVIPFVPIKGVTMDECVALAKECGERIFRELQIPVYLYEKAATRPERENLAAVRKGQFEGIRADIATSEARRPDFGEPRVHPTAGITAVGARAPLIAYNVNLGTSDIEIANKVARAVRHLSGGLRYVKALGFELKDRRIVQVSMNMVNYEGTPLFRAFDMVKREAERYGVQVVGSEIVGLVPQAALDSAADFYLRLENFSQNQILEQRLAAALEESGAGGRGSGVSEEKTGENLLGSVGSFAELVASSAPTPGGGSVAAHTGMLAAALGRMVCNLTIGKPKFADREARLVKIRSELEELGARLKQLIEEDAGSFDVVMAAYRLPKASDVEKQERAERIEDATRGAIEVPMDTARRSMEVAKRLEEIAEIGNPNAVSDVAVGARLSEAAIRGASYNVRINLKSLSDSDWAGSISDEINNLIDEARRIAESVEARV
jgi:glutamate formiminotransferase/formiminotetrahydrofolate cyclodeaminase